MKIIYWLPHHVYPSTTVHVYILTPTHIHSYMREQRKPTTATLTNVLKNFKACRSEERVTDRWQTWIRPTNVMKGEFTS
jgi:hypothetical protein